MKTPSSSALDAGVEGGARDHLERLLGSWGMIADLSFSDLLLFIPAAEEPDETPDRTTRSERKHRRTRKRFVVAGQMRPATSQTLFPSDRVGEVVDDESLVEEAWQSGTIVAGVGAGEEDVGPVRREAVPVRFEGAVIAVVVRVWSPRIGRRVGGLELVYRRISERLMMMVASGLFPFHTAREAIEDEPRVGDGVIVIDEGKRITFASPNAVNALHRLRSASSIVGAQLAEIGVGTRAVEDAFSERIPAIEEIERPLDVRVIFHCIPLVDGHTVVGAAVLLRDVTDLRRRDRLLLSKDAAIREVHHRVKNNLQTISSLLRLQSRRMGPGRAQTALEEAERRIRSIAVVHDALSREPTEHIAFSEIVPALIDLAQDANAGGPPVAVRVNGEAAGLATDIATPLALVVAELLQNATEHGRPNGSQALSVDLTFSSDDEELSVEVRDDGLGFPAGFDLDTTSGLGLSIVRDLVRTQLRGSITAHNENGAVVRLVIPLIEARVSVR